MATTMTFTDSAIQRIKPLSKTEWYSDKTYRGLRLTQQFNDLLVGKTALLCDEAFFTGSPQQQLMLKNLITADDWTFEPKNRKSFTTPNIFRMIATTNNNHAVAIDNDDRRWTIIQSVPSCPHDPNSRAARDWWAPFYRLIRNQPGVVLRYLLDYKVDRRSRCSGASSPSCTPIPPRRRSCGRP